MPSQKKKKKTSIQYFKLNVSVLYTLSSLFGCLGYMAYQTLLLI